MSMCLRLPLQPPPGNRAKVFVSYSRKDLAFAQMMVGALAERGFDAFLDKTDIAPGEPWKERLAGLIATADTVVFTVSPDSVASTICAWELEESARLGKRIIPVVARRIADADAPPALGRLNWVFLAEGDDKDAALATLDTALHTDLPWVREHTRLGELARHWDEQGRRQGRDVARRGPRSRRTLARPPPCRRQRADRSASGLHPGEPARCDRKAALLGRRLARRRRHRNCSRRFRRDQPPRGPDAARARRAHAQLWRPAPQTASSSTWRRNSAMSSACRPRRSRTFSIGHGSCRTSSWEQANRTQSLRRSQAEALDETADTLLTLGETESALAAAQSRRKKSSRLCWCSSQPAQTFNTICRCRTRGRRRTGGAGQSAGRADLLSGGPSYHRPPGEVRPRQCRLAARSGGVVR